MLGKFICDLAKVETEKYKTSIKKYFSNELSLDSTVAALNTIYAIKPANVEKVKEELADVFAFAFLLADKYNFNVTEIVLEKIKKNGEKYPIDKAKGTAKKYTDL